MQKYIFFIFIILITGCSHLQDTTEQNIYDTRLIGTWKSDKDKTIQWLRENRNLCEEKIARISKIFGKLKITISETTTKSEYDGNIEEEPNDIIAIEGDTIAVGVVDALTNCPTIRLIRIEDENTYSIYQDMFDIREFFTRIE
jgi:hypothetical protein